MPPHPHVHSVYPHAVSLLTKQLCGIASCSTHQLVDTTGMEGKITRYIVHTTYTRSTQSTQTQEQDQEQEQEQEQEQAHKREKQK